MELSRAIRHWAWRHNRQLQETIALLPSWQACERLRRAFYRRALRECGEGLEISQHVVVRCPERVSVGSGVFINRGCFIAAHAEIAIGDNVSIGHYVIITSGEHRYGDRRATIRDQGYRVRPIVIHDDVWIGAHAVILKGTTLGQGCVVGAGAVVTRDVPPYTVVVGAPARPLRERTDTLALQPSPVELPTIERQSG